MSQILELSRFYIAILEDARINTTHISLYMALFQKWNLEGFQTPIQVKRWEVMELAKISSSATYHKCLNQLIEYGYINYIPSFNPTSKSEVYLNQNYQPKKDIGSAGAQPLKR